MKLVTTKIVTSRDLPSGHEEKKSDAMLVREINQVQGSSVSVKSASMMVQERKVGVPPKNIGPSKGISIQLWNLTKCACLLFLNIEQAIRSRQSTMKKLVLRTKKCLYKGGLIEKTCIVQES